MSKIFTLPFNPIPWDATPQDLTGGNTNLGLSTSDTTQRYVAGTRSLEWDGSVYKYGKASAVMTSFQAGAKFTDTAADVTYEALPGGESAGGRTLTITQGSITEDLYQGGLLTLFYSGAGDGTTFTVQGNDATSGTTTKLYLDRVLPLAVTASHSCELFPNPYMAIAQNSSTGESVVGPPMAIIASASFGWFKTRGPAFLSAQANVGVAYTQAAYWRHDGSVDVGTSAGAAFVTDQYAGYSLSDGVTAGPLIMLQGSL